MFKLDSFGKVLIIIGLGIFFLGLFLVFFKKIPFLNQLGHLPGDIHLQKKNVRFYFPITTSLIISVILSLIIYLLRKIGR